MVVTFLSLAGHHTLLKDPVGDKTLDVAYDGRPVVVGASALELARMRAVASVDLGEGFAALDCPVGIFVPPRVPRTSSCPLWTRRSRFSCCTLLTCVVEVADVAGIIYVAHIANGFPLIVPRWYRLASHNYVAREELGSLLK